MDCPEDAVYCKWCKYRKDEGVGGNTYFVCKIYWVWRCDEQSRWKCYKHCSIINRKNNCPNFKLTFLGKTVKLFKSKK